MARTYGDVFGPAFLAEGLTAANATEVRTLLADTALRDGLIGWMNAVENQGADEGMWKAGFPQLAGLTNGQIRTVMRVIAALAKGEYVP